MRLASNGCFWQENVKYAAVILMPFYIFQILCSIYSDAFSYVATTVMLFELMQILCFWYSDVFWK